MYHEIGKGKSKRRNTRSVRSLLGNRNSQSEGKADARMCVVCRWYKTHEEERERWNLCTFDRFSADGFRTRVARVIRRLVLGVRATKWITGKGGKVRPRDSWAREKWCVCVGVRSVSAGRGPEGRFMVQPNSVLCIKISRSYSLSIHR